jgi:hypothetical protein
LVGRAVRYSIDVTCPCERGSHYDAREGERGSHFETHEGEPDSRHSEPDSPRSANDVRDISEPRSPDPSVKRDLETSVNLPRAARAEEHRGSAAACALDEQSEKPELDDAEVQRRKALEDIRALQARDFRPASQESP